MQLNQRYGLLVLGTKRRFSLSSSAASDKHLIGFDKGLQNGRDKIQNGVENVIETR